ncbi:MAG: tRNA (adenosine(37)-N6)-threonylcarbamoyltransferase complex ATPase subunit type 1 TsaE [Actinomycetota bacterium]
MRTDIRTATAEDTRAVGRALAALLRPGDALALTGELGAGKTTFVQGLASGLGFDGHVVSPTFTLVREYQGRMRIHHVDVYRLEHVQDVLDLGLDDAIAEGGVLFVEWGDAVEGLLPPEHLVVTLTTAGKDETRSIGFEGVGAAWRLRWEQLERVLEPFGGPEPPEPPEPPGSFGGPERPEPPGPWGVHEGMTP